jgi:3-deoxy-D-manno-octulosonate 8-phosphate phosphatase KdsC-like HAD superfamily phosphatase
MRGVAFHDNANRAPKRISAEIYPALWSRIFTLMKSLSIYYKGQGIAQKHEQPDEIKAEFGPHHAEGRRIGDQRNDVPVVRAGFFVSG